MRLSDKTLAHARNVQLPNYDRSRLSTGILHLGVGNFQRAHQAVYIDDGLKEDPSWGIAGVSLRRPVMSEALEPQNGLYTLGIENGTNLSTRIIGSIREIIFAGADRKQVIQRCSNSAVRLISLTVTEKAYCFEMGSGNLLENHPEIQADLKNPDNPVSIPGILVAGLRARREAGAGPVTILSCDNLPDNGGVTRKAVAQFADLLGDGLSEKLLSDVTFPSTMIDRIVPATTDADRARIAIATGLDDAWPVITEPFSQWVVEDRFAAGLPAFPGVELVSDVAPYELMKLRMLNGAHSALAYLGQIGGFEKVSDAMGNDDLSDFIRQMWECEVIPTLTMPKLDLLAYSKKLEARFLNTALRHQTVQIAADGSQKITQRILSTLTDLRQSGLPHKRLSTALAAWLVFSSGADGQFKPVDPLAEKFRNIAETTLPDFRAYLCQLTVLMPSLDDIIADPIWEQEIVETAGRLYKCNGDITPMLKRAAKASHDL
jgi:fructuronate reductase